MTRDPDDDEGNRRHSSYVTGGSRFFKIRSFNTRIAEGEPIYSYLFTASETSG